MEKNSVCPASITLSFFLNGGKKVFMSSGFVGFFSGGWAGCWVGFLWCWVGVFFIGFFRGGVFSFGLFWGLLDCFYKQAYMHCIRYVRISFLIGRSAQILESVINLTLKILRSVHLTTEDLLKLAIPCM